MSAKEILEGIKAFFNAPVVTPQVTPQPVVEPFAGTTFKLKDGSEISITMANPAEISVGDAVSINGAPAPAADYELEDGSIVTVDEMGKVAVVVMPTPQTQPDFAAPTTPTLEQRIAEIEKKLGVIATTPAAPVQFEVEFKEEIGKHKEVIKQLFDLVEKLVDAPMTEPHTLNGNKKEQFERRNKKESVIDRIATARKQQTKILS